MLPGKEPKLAESLDEVPPRGDVARHEDSPGEDGEGVHGTVSARGGVASPRVVWPGRCRCGGCGRRGEAWSWTGSAPRQSSLCAGWGVPHVGGRAGSRRPSRLFEPRRRSFAGGAGIGSGGCRQLLPRDRGCHLVTFRLPPRHGRWSRSLNRDDNIKDSEWRFHSEYNGYYTGVEVLFLVPEKHPGTFTTRPFAHRKGPARHMGKVNGDCSLLVY